MNAKKRYKSDFYVKTKSLIFLIGNIFDAYSFLASACNVSTEYEDGVMLEINDYNVSNF
jgi:hypothetical protein